jgi:AcrR family transcriptional regulator
MKTAEKTTEAVREEILEAAFQRFGKFGLGKSTMAEIASDCNMSAGNLYRFYKNKAEIGAACAQHCMGESEKCLLEAINRKDLNSAERLENFIILKLDYIYGQFSEHPLHHELVGFISNERPDLVHGHLEKMQSMLTGIIDDGNRQGEFDVADSTLAAGAVLSACSKFIAPHFLSLYTLEQLKNEAISVVQLLIKGLASR